MSSESRHAVQVLFLEPIPKDHWMNRLTGFLGGMFHGRGACHVEICIPNGKSFLSCSIYNGEKVTLSSQKTFANPGYAVHTLEVNGEQLSNIRSFLSACHAQGQSFDKNGMYLATLPFPVPRSRKGTFCSKLVTEALQRGGVRCVQGLNADIVSPSKLWKLLRKGEPALCGTVRYKQNQLLEKGVGMETRGLLSGAS